MFTDVLIFSFLLCTVYSQIIKEDVQLDFKGLAERYGMKCEEHFINTEDGYILKLFHIVGDKNRPILLMHGIADSSDTFMVRGNTSLTSFLAISGYDVWAANIRGNKYSRNHTLLNPDEDKQFWDYSLHENAIYDLAATIDYILYKTKQNQLSSIAHSQGNTLFYTLGAMKPEYNDKVKIMIALSPIAFIHHVRPPSKTIIDVWPLLDKVLSEIKYEELFNENTFGRKIFRAICSQPLGYEICLKGVGMSVAGYDPDELEPEFWPIIMGHYPSGTSRKSLTHILQFGKTKRFAQMDYGEEMNLVHYNRKMPPDYDLSKVTMRIALMAGLNDGMCAIEDVIILKRLLPNVVEFRILDHGKANHMDFVWGKNMGQYLFPYIQRLLLKYE